MTTEGSEAFFGYLAAQSVQIKHLKYSLGDGVVGLGVLGPVSTEFKL